MNRPLLKALATAVPISLLLWGVLALTAVQAAERYRPGFRHHLKASMYQAAGLGAAR
jgi:hypothetical protein